MLENAGLVIRHTLAAGRIAELATTAGGMDGLGHPVESDVAEQFIFAETAFHIAITVCPVAKFLHDPGGKPDRRIIQAVSRSLRRVSLQVRVGATVDVPAVRVVEELPLNVVESSAGFEMWLVRSRNVIEMDADELLGMTQSQNRAHRCAEIASLSSETVITQLFHQRGPKLGDAEEVHAAHDRTVRKAKAGK